ncbi:MAG: right-handed parallel beta-helix repeat-containing protein [Anaerolineae bacterium]|nr:right-handed parallel beta-helix repeat-containing protein [Anaerolineae bacterium]
MQRSGLILIMGGVVTAVALLILSQQNSQAAPLATTYYVCDCQPGADGDCAAGSDANSGTSPGAPWQTYEKARTQFNSLAGGDEIRFCQGGAFELGSSSGQWVNSSCSSTFQCTVADYAPPWASGDEMRPILQRSGSGYGFDLADGGNASADGGYIFQNLDLRCTACGSSGWAFFFYNDVNDVLIDNVRMDGFDIGVHLAGSNACTPGDVACNGQNDRVTLRNLTILNSGHQGVLGGANDLLIENSYFENNGDGSMFDHNIYISGGSRMTIRHNELYRSSLDGSGSCGGTSLVGHGVMTDLLIEGNYVHEDIGKANQGCWGIAITPAYSTAESFSNVTIRGNRIENVGNTAIGTASCQNCTIENNVIIQNQGFGVTGVSVPAQLPGAGDAISQNIVIRNNSIWTNTGTGIRLNEGSSHAIVSNAIQATSATSGWNCLDATMATGNYNVINHNVCGYSAGEWANAVGDLAAWQVIGWGINSIADVPGFVSGADLRPGSETAVIVNAGSPGLSSQTDFNGNGRDSLPDVGAFEWLGALEKLFLPLVIR